MRPKKLGPRAFASLYAAFKSCDSLSSISSTRSTSTSSLTSLTRSTSSLSYSSRSSSAEDLRKMSPNESPSPSSYYRSFDHFKNNNNSRIMKEKIPTFP